MADEMVLATQKWLNETYKNVEGFGSVPENGKTGWDTVYGLIRGLQHELGIAELANNFGETTYKLFNEIAPNIKVGYKGNIAYIIQGGFWCKGINPTSFNGEFSDLTVSAIKQLQTDAGLENVDGTINSMLLKALLDMSAFVLVGNGDKNIRSMQQMLNRNYNSYFGLLPCDGIYQRDTNKALIYALQAEEGLDTNTANGNYGDTTTALTPTLNQGASGNFVKILQWGLYVNGFNKNAQFDGNFNSYISSEVKAFREFMVLNPYNTTADMTVIKGLLTSAGNTKRDSIACDTATQLSLEQIQALKSSGFSKVGRYLTGAVGENEVPKNLTTKEITNLVNEGFSIFPIYEDGGYKEEYFTAEQGIQDGYLAGDAASDLGFAKDTVIYFAVDVDFQDADIDGTVMKYIQNVQRIVSTYGYKTGIYGTRNVCLHAKNNGISYFFVSDMSTGWSGNLGFRMPEEWCFDQFFEFKTSSGLDVDQVAASGRDEGCSSFSMDTDAQLNSKVHQLIDAMPLFNPLNNIEFEWNQTYGPYHIPGVDLWVVTTEGWSNITDKDLPFSIKNGKIDSSYKEDVASLYRVLYGEENYLNVINAVNRIAKKIQNGQVVYTLATRAEEPNQIGMKITVNTTVKKGTESVKASISMEWYYRQVMGDSPYPAAEYADKLEKIKSPDFDWKLNLPAISMHAQTGTLVAEVGLLAFIAFFGLLVIA